jgi:hypothetical protein
MCDNGPSVKTSIKAYIRYLRGRSLDSDCNLRSHHGKCMSYDPTEVGGYSKCVGLKKCNYYDGKETRNIDN